MKKVEMRKAGSLLKVEVTKVEIFEWVDTRIGKDNGKWMVWEFTTGRPIGGGASTKKKAIEKVTEILTFRGKETTHLAISLCPKINSYDTL